MKPETAEFDLWMASAALRRFVAESNRIEGIHREPLDSEIYAHCVLLVLKDVGVDDLERFVATISPSDVLRDRVGLNVYVGRHVPPPGGPAVRGSLEVILDRAPYIRDPFQTHCAYEVLHPFTDGNGRSGRALWLYWMLRMGRNASALGLGFLHSFYYQTLEHQK